MPSVLLFVSGGLALTASFPASCLLSVRFSIESCAAPIRRSHSYSHFIAAGVPATWSFNVSAVFVLFLFLCDFVEKVHPFLCSSRSRHTKVAERRQNSVRNPAWLAQIEQAWVPDTRTYNCTRRLCSRVGCETKAFLGDKEFSTAQREDGKLGNNFQLVTFPLGSIVWHFTSVDWFSERSALSTSDIRNSAPMTHR